MLTQDSLAPIRNDASSVARVFIAPTALPDDPATLQQILRAALAEIERLRLLIAGLQRNRFGRRSEQLDDAAFQQGVEDLEQSLAEQAARLDARPISRGHIQRRRPRRVRPHRAGASATVAHCRRICRGSSWWWMSRTRRVPVAAAHCMSSAKTGRRCWTTCLPRCGCG